MSEPELVNQRFLLVGSEARVGGQAEIRRAVDTWSPDGAYVAVKFLRIRDDDDAVKVFFERETDALRAIDHPNVVRLIDAGRDAASGRHFVALEWVEDDLEKRLARGHLSWQGFFDEIGLPLASALSWAHLHEIEHRDVKPRNVLISSANVVKLADFGIAKLRDKLSDPEQTVSDYRTALYSPPEVDGAVPWVRDVYAYGVLAVRSMSAAQLSSPTDVAVALDEIERLPPELRRFLHSCVSADPHLRPKNCAVLEAELIEALQACGAREDRRHNQVWLKLRARAASTVLGTDARQHFGAAEAAVMEDLNASRAYVEFGFDPKTRQADKDQIQLYGQRFRYVMVPDSDRDDRHVIISARELDDKMRHGMQTHACPLPPIVTWTFDEPSAKAAYEGTEALLKVLDEHLAAVREERASQQAGADDLKRLLQDWRRVLDAREELARGSQRPVEYQGYRTGTNGVVIFNLVGESDQDLLDQEWEVHDTSKRLCARGDVVKQDDDTVTIRFRRPGELPTNGVLVPSTGPSGVALKRQRDALAKIEADEAANSALGAILADPASLSVGPPSRIETWQRGDLDRSKQEVVRHALGTQDLVLVEGPPGTGKTTVIAEIVGQTLRKSPRTKILIVSQTHIAIDNALVRLEQAGVDGIVRLGRPQDPKVAAEAQKFLLDRQVKKWIAQVKQRADLFITELAKQHGVDTRHLQAALVLEQLIAALGDINHVEGLVASLASGPIRVAAETSRGPGEDLLAARERLDKLKEIKDELLAEVRTALAGDLTMRDELTVADARAAVETILAGVPNAVKLTKILKLQGEWLQRIGSDDHLTESFLKTRSIVAGTAIGFLGHRSVRDLTFDLCIFDEASKATATESLVSMARAKRWVFVGDTRQLPPVDEDLLRNERLMQSHDVNADSVKTTLFQYLADRTTAPVKHLLREQYRMIQPIGDMISACFYQDQLVSPRIEGLAGYGHLAKPVLWLDTGGRGADRREARGTGGNTSIVNRAEVNIAYEQLEVVARAIGQGIVAVPEGRDLEVLLIAPYSRQVQEIQRKLDRVKLAHVSAAALTVDQVQGRECDLAIFSVTRSNEKGIMGFIGKDYWRRINVALSRARFGLIVVGDAPFCRAQPGALQDVLNYMSDHRDVCEIRDAS
ncbi:protein kinase [Catenulispora sp. NL8]|uniref:Protein kinase n=1 Tax=Catenulispora pinistramenti TaxID=2705254 RepID=A0ABS5KSM8_9ACTN|nr:serine/threonine-protein kinase [Catenulispora pinistramenti]MBS2549010.1 protein kinase [Catenulispora pinistramenti]